MATSINYPKCSICSETFKEPKILDCLHTFCEKCLQDYHEKSHAGLPTILCPLCGQTIRLPVEGVHGLRANFALVGVPNPEGMRKRTEALCGMCTEGKAALHRCLECEQNICPSCSDMHQLITACSSHTIASLDGVQEGGVMTPIQTAEPRCLKHEGEVMQFFCETCEELICRDCTVTEHCEPEHNWVDVKVATLKRKQSLENTFPVLNAIIEENKETLEAVAKARQEFKHNIRMTVKEVQDRAAEVIAKVKADEKRLIDEIKTVEQERGRAFRKHEKTVHDQILQEQQHSLEIVQDIASNWSSDSNLLSLYPIITNDLNSLMNSPNIPEIDQGLSYMRLAQKHHVVGDNVLGELEQVTNRQWELHLEFGKEKTRFRGAIDVHFLSTEEIAVADYDRKQVAIHSTAGNQKSIIQMTTGPRRVAYLNGQLVVVDETECVKVYNTNGTLACEFPTVEDSSTSVHLFGLTVNKNVILVGDIERKVLTEHRPDGSLIRTIPVKTPPWYLAVDINGRVVISGWYELVVDVVDEKGDTLFTIKPTLKDQQVQCCTGVCCEDSDIYIALRSTDEDTGHIHRYNGEGKFLSCIAQGICYPRGVTLSEDGQIAVADRQSIKLYRKV